jgi:hypothetical protein
MSDEIEEPRAVDLVGEGWEGLDALDKKLANAPKASPSEIERLGGLALKVFSADEGHQVLEWMITSTLRRSSVPDIGAECMLMKPEDLASYVLWNEAQKSFVLRVIGLMEAGKRSKKPKRTKR